MFDPELYRSKQEVEGWKQRCPVALMIKRLQDNGWMDEDDLEQIEKEIAAEIEDAIVFAEQSEWEAIEDLTRFVYSDQEVP